MDPSWQQNAIKNRSYLETPKGTNVCLNHWTSDDSGRFGGRSCEPKSVKNQSKNEVQDGLHLGTDF